MSVAVSVVVPHWNRRDLLPTVLSALRGQTLAPAEILVVDNGSTDDSVTVANQMGARVIALGSNRGFAHAVNAGVRAATGTWVAVVNNDVTLPPDWLERLWTGAAQAGALVAVGKLLDAARPDWLDGSYDVISRSGCAWRAGAARRDGPCWNEPAAAMLAPLTATLVRRDVFDRVGLLEEGFESYLEDVEFGLRCWRAGVPGVYVPTATARHRGSATLGRWHPDTVRRIARNQVWLVARHWPAAWMQWLWPVLVGQGLWGLVAVRHGAGAAWLRGKWDGLRAWPAWRDQRQGRSKMFWQRVAASEAALRALQSDSGMDAYWRWYFRLVPRYVGDDAVWPSAGTAGQDSDTGRWPVPQHSPVGRATLAVVIVTFNSGEVIASCLDACRRHLPAGSEVVVVDNASTDGTAALVEGQPGVRLLANVENRGFAGGCNQGIRATDAPYMLLLNPDAVLLNDPSPLVDTAERTGAGAVGGWLEDEQGRFQAGFAVRRLPTAWNLAAEALGVNRLLPDHAANRRYRCLDLDPAQPAVVEQPAGAFLLLRRAAWLQLGGLDESFHPVWFEDVDLCARLRQYQWLVWYQPAARARHAGGHSAKKVTPDRRPVYWYGSLLRYCSRHLPRRAWMVCLAVAVAGVMRGMLAVVTTRSLQSARPYRTVVSLAMRSLAGRSGNAPSPHGAVR